VLRANWSLGELVVGQTRLGRLVVGEQVLGKTSCSHNFEAAFSIFNQTGFQLE